MEKSTLERFANNDWLVEHSTELDKYAGKWVAIGEQKLLAVADTLKELMEASEVKKLKQKAKEPLVMQIPTPEDAFVIL